LNELIVVNEERRLLLSSSSSPSPEEEEIEWKPIEEKKNDREGCTTIITTVTTMIELLEVDSLKI
jgi:hypothetical protein